MKLVRYSYPNPVQNVHDRRAFVKDDYVVDAHLNFSPFMKIFNNTYILDVLSQPKERKQLRQTLENMDLAGDHALNRPVYLYREAKLRPPVEPVTLRDFYSFENHVKTARAKRGLDVMAEWYQFPVFYFSNPHTIFGPDATIPYPKGTQRLDFELEVAAVIGIAGQDIPVDEADSHIAGFTIMNDWSARDIQAAEMKVGLGPAKGKDFATSLGPWLVTPDELEDRRSGKSYDLTMIARRNGIELSRGNWNSIYYSFAEMIARASENVMLNPGDVIGSGTVGTGCILELGPETVGGWLQPGDVVELEIERLGVLRNIIGPKV